MKKNLLRFCLLCAAYWLPGCGGQRDYRAVMHDPAQYVHTLKKVTDVIVHDIFSPPQATRIYAYTTIAAYEAMAPGDSAYRSLAGQLHGLKEMPVPDPGKPVDYPFASLLAMSEVGKALIFSEDPINKAMDSLKAMALDAGMPDDIYRNSLAYADTVAAAILAWCRQDHYAETRSAPKYTVTDDPSRWKPTPPAYMQGVEPHWDELRTFVLDSPSQFMPPPLPPFDTAKGSAYYLMEDTVCMKGMYLTQAEKDTADFWDCNPYKLNVSGHVMFATKKISPPGHWMNICGIITRKTDANFDKTAYTHARAAIAMADAAISCWCAKYRFMQLRPETYINEYINPAWKPYLQTPPFPDYTSAHSVMSAAVAVVLTDIYGDHFAFHDASEMEYGAGEMDFSSIQNAADVAAISRFYGGIHTLVAANEGVKTGKKIGRFMVSRLEWKPAEQAGKVAMQTGK